MNRIIKEPLLHFLLLGALIYLSSMMLSDNNQAQEIIVSEGKIKHLSTLYSKTWQREPTQEELEKVVQEYVLEQAAYNEGVKLGLDKNDIVIKRRVHQKLDFIAEESAATPKATDELLLTYLSQHPDKFRTEPILSIRQIYLDPKEQVDTSGDLLTKLQQDPEQNITHLGHRSLFKPVYRQQQSSELKRIFGNQFIQEIRHLSVGKWYGPVQSGFGSHFIYIEGYSKGTLPELAEIRSEVLREWENGIRQQSKKQYYDELLTRYPATIHWPVEN